MERTKVPAITGLVLGTFLLTRDVQTTFALDKPIHTGIFVLVSCAATLIAVSRYLQRGGGRSHHGAAYDAVPLHDIGLPHGSRESSPSLAPEETRHPSSLQTRRVSFLLLVVSLFLRVLIFRKTLLNTQCLSAGWEQLIPLVFAVWDYWRVQRRQKLAVPENMNYNAFQHLDERLTRVPSRYVFAAGLVTFGCLVGLSASRGPDSTMICGASVQSRWFLSVTQSFGTVLDIVILYCIGRLLQREGERSVQEMAFRFISVAWSALFAAGILAITGAIYFIFADWDREWILTITSLYFWSTLKFNVLACITAVCMIFTITHVGVMTTSLMMSFCSTFTLTSASTWSNPHPFPSTSSGLGFTAVLASIIGFAIYFHVDASSEKVPAWSLVRPISSKISARFYLLMLCLLIFRGINWVSHTNLMSYHPIDLLLFEAELEHEAYKNQTSASKSLKDAVENYKTRYKRYPPPNFNSWYKFATERKSYVIDDYDSIERDLAPFYSLKPAAIRDKTWQIGANPDNEAGLVSIRRGSITISPNVPGTHRWMLDGVVELVKPFEQYLPDMDLAFNLNDEPRVTVPYEELEKMRTIDAKPNDLQKKPKHSKFSGGRSGQWKRISDEPGDEKPLSGIFKGSAKLFYTWGNAGCPPGSPARSERFWNLGSLCMSCTSPQSLGGFLANWTIAEDICHQPDLASLHGFYLMPAAFQGTHELYPMFSQSKVHGFNDILYPSPWNYLEKAKYDPSDEHPDKDFSKKNSTIFWRGATSEGLSNGGGQWKGMMRQRFVHLANDVSRTASKQPLLLPRSNKEEDHKLKYSVLPVSTIKEVLKADVHIVAKIERCGGRDCEEQAQALGPLVEPSDFQSHWEYKYLLDFDGAGFSGRFIPFLRSKSLPFKAALFREWWSDRVTAWQHFVPLDSRGHGFWATLAYFAGVEGKINGKRIKMEPHEHQAARIANNGKEWAEKVLRKEDMEIYFFRLLLEWGRLTDDARDDIGYGGPE